MRSKSVPPLENIICRDGDFDNLDEKDEHGPKSSNGTSILGCNGMENNQKECCSQRCPVLSRD